MGAGLRLALRQVFRGRHPGPGQPHIGRGDVLGRNKNAEARWLLPMICRRGHVTKSDVGAIRVFDRETRFEITAEAVGRFEAALAKVSGDADGGKIQRAEDGPPQERRPPPRQHRGAPSGPRPPPRRHEGEAPRHAGKPAASGAFKPWAPRPDGAPGAPRPDRPPKGPKGPKGPKKRKSNG